ncbi:MAG: ABC transporter permease [Nitrospirae bacterium]|nr:ABC transporter permease [Nitrospirota bacterium]
MNRYLLKRLAAIPLLAIGITFLVFLLMRAIPGDPALALAGEKAGAAALENIRRELGTDRPFLVQYAGYLGLLARGELGRSYFTNRPVARDIVEKFPNTLALACAAMAVAVPIGVLLGLFMTLARSRMVEKAVSIVTMAGVSLPVFWIGLVLMFLLSLKLRLFPPSGTGDMHYLALPALTLALPALASVARITKTVTTDIMRHQFMTTARAKGIARWRVVLVHLLRNALIPLVTVIGLDFGSYLNGAVLTETIFGWDGVGRYAMDAIIKRDYPVVMGTVLAGTMVFVGINLAVDLLYSVLDPRVRKR